MEAASAKGIQTGQGYLRGLILFTFLFHISIIAQSGSSFRQQKAQDCMECLDFFVIELFKEAELKH